MSGKPDDSTGGDSAGQESGERSHRSRDSSNREGSHHHRRRRSRSPTPTPSDGESGVVSHNSNEPSNKEGSSHHHHRRSGNSPAPTEDSGDSSTRRHHHHHHETTQDIESGVSSHSTHESPGKSNKSDPRPVERTSESVWDGRTRINSLFKDDYNHVLVEDVEDVGPLEDTPGGSPMNRSLGRSAFGSIYNLVGGTSRYGSLRNLNENAVLNRTKSIGKLIFDTVVETATLDDSRIASRFASWNRQQLVDILVKNGIELRAETTIRTSSLRELAEDFFKGKPLPRKPAPLTRYELGIVEHGILLLQNLWVERLERKRLELMDREDEVQAYQDEDDFDYTADIEAMAGQDTIEVPIEYIEDDVDFNDEEIGGQSVSSMRIGSQDLVSPPSVPSSTRNRVSFAELPVDPPKRRSFFVELSQSITNLTGGSKPITPKKATTPKDKKTLTFTKSIHVPMKAVQFLDLEWKPPDFAKARKYIDFFHPRKGGKGGMLYDIMKTTTGRHCCLGFLGEQCDIMKEGQMSEFAVYGPGVTNYFKFLKFCFVIFGILSLIALPTLLVNLYGPFQYSGGLSELAVTTVGNVANSRSNSTDRIIIPICRTYGGYDYDCTISRYTLGQFYSWTDVLIVCTLMLGFFWLKYFESEEQKQLDKNTLFASQYTIMVSNLPPTITEDEIRQKFTQLGNQYPIAQISVAYDNEVEIALCRERGQLIRNKKNAIHEHRYFTTTTRTSYAEKNKIEEGENVIKVKRVEFFRKIRDIDAKIKSINKNLTYHSMKEQIPLVAFITYNDDIASNILINEYLSTGFLAWLFGHDKFKCSTALKPKEFYRLKIEEAPEPSTILWENLKYTPVERYIRRTIATTVAILMIFISICITLGAKYFSLRYFQNTGTTGQCPSGFNSLSSEEQQSIVRSDPNDYTHCYCAPMSTFEQANDSLCKEYLKSRLSAQFFTFFSSFIVLVVNVGIEAVTQLTSKFEKHHTDDRRGEAVFFRLFFLKYFNTGALFLIENNYSIIQSIFGLSEEDSQEFTPSWYQSVGVTIILIQLGNIFLSHILKFFQATDYFRKLKRAEKDPKYALTQDDLNKAHIGPNFRMAFNTAQIMSTMGVILTFSTGMPLLYIVGAVNFFIYYIVEKYLYVRVYRAPPRWTSKIIKLASSLLPVLCILHLCMSIWIITDPTLFDQSHRTLFGSYIYPYVYQAFGNSSNVASRILDSQSFRLAVFALILAIGVVLRVAFYYVALIFDRLSKFFCNFRCFSAGINASLVETDTTLVTYSRAIQRNLIKGLATYNILQNPQYKEDFGITWKFAVEHGHIRSIRFDQGGAIDEEDDVAKAERITRERNQAAGLSQSPTQGFLRSRFFGKSLKGVPANGQKPLTAPKKQNRQRVKNSSQPAVVAPDFIARQRALLGAGESQLRMA